MYIRHTELTEMKSHRMMRQNWILLVVFTAVVTSQALEAYDPCCSFPCHNKAVCVPSSDYSTYTCDCTGSNYYGQNCDIPLWSQWLKKWIAPSTEAGAEALVHNRPFWRLVESLPSFKTALLANVYIVKQSYVTATPLYSVNGYHYTTMDHVTNRQQYTSLLPPIFHCPTPQGTYGKPVLPPVDKVLATLFQRKDFIPSTLGANLLYASVSQAFAYHFFKPDAIRGPGYSRGDQEIDLAHLYGTDPQTESLLRSHVDGKMKMQVINDEEYPSYLSDVPHFTANPMDHSVPYGYHYFALGDSNYGLHPGLFLFQTIWLREHNRICDIMKAENPDWDDERLFQTTKLILIAETANIFVEDFVTSTYNFNIHLEFKPGTLKGRVFNFDNRIYAEYKQVLQWHQLIPDQVDVQGQTYTTDDFMLHPELVITHGTKNFTEALVSTLAGEITLRNHAPGLIDSARNVIEEGRKNHLQPYNQYRKRFDMKPMESFEELTGGHLEYSKLLEELYGDIDAVELYVGLMAEGRRTKGLFGMTLYDIFGSFSIKVSYSSPLCAPGLWKPSTFGGEVGFNIVRSSSLKKIFCDNIPGPCPRMSLRVPGEFEENNLWYMET